MTKEDFLKVAAALHDGKEIQLKQSFRGVEIWVPAFALLTKYEYRIKEVKK